MDASDIFPVRNIRFAMDGEVPRHWHGGRRAVTAFFNNLSTLFPHGERFFVASVNRFKGQIADEKLLAEVKAFCGQEGFHSREHVRYNRMLAAHGYPVEAMEAFVARLLERVTRTAPARARLAATCALEHFTATLAHCVLSDPELLAGAHPVMAALWRWHAAEENEHKSVAYDVYYAVGGHYRERVVVMAAATLIFWAVVAWFQARLMRADGILWSPREWGALFSFLWIKPGGMRRMWRIYVDYYRPRFHPWQLDNRALLEAWKRELAASPVYQEVA